MTKRNLKPSNQSLSGMGEFGLINLLNSVISPVLPEGVLGIGDDCAVLPPRIDGDVWTVLTVDSMVENRHFCRSYYDASDVGWKLVASTISDIAAMGGIPKWGLISLCCPNNTDVAWITEMYRGIREASDVYGFSVLGGDTVSGSELTLSLTAIGECNVSPVLRSGAVVGDDVWVSGSVGASATGLRLLQQKREILSDLQIAAVSAHCHPEAQVELGQRLSAGHMVNAMIDVSDGLLQDMRHVAESSGVTIELDLTSIPVSPTAIDSGLSVTEALIGGEDYQLVFTSSANRRCEIETLGECLNMTELCRIGRILSLEQHPVFLLDSDGTRSSASSYLLKYTGNHTDGFSHF